MTGQNLQEVGVGRVSRKPAENVPSRWGDIICVSPQQWGRSPGGLTLGHGKGEVTVTLAWIAPEEQRSGRTWFESEEGTGHSPVVTCPLSLGFLVCEVLTALQDHAVTSELMALGPGPRWHPVCKSWSL